MSERLEPIRTPEAGRFWQGCERGELWIQRCSRCGPFFYPRTFCPSCGSRDVDWIQASGSATLHSYVVSHIPAQGYEPPYVAAVVSLDEGPRMMSNIVGVEPSPESLILDMPLRVQFEQRGETFVPVFAPAEAEDARG